MKKTIKIFITVIMSVLIVCFSCLTAFADTTVDGSSDHLKFLKDNVININFERIPDFNLSQLPVDDYLTFLNKSYSLNGSYNLSFVFIPQSSKKIAYLGSDVISDSEMQDDTIYIYHVHNGSYEYLKVKTSTPIYCLNYSASGKYWFNVLDSKTECAFGSNNSGSYYNGASDMLFVNNQNLAECFDKIDNIDYVHVNMSYRDVALFCYTDLFANITQIVPGYTGAVYDSSLEHILESNGKTCDDTIIDKYKYQIYYSLNNDLRMVFLNNAYQPEYKKDKFKGTNSDDAYKYKFHYNKTSDCIVYYPTFQMYLSYDDWYKFQPEDKSFKWWWEKDTKDFTLISDWKYSNGTYTGTRVATNWEKLNQLGESADFTAISSFITDKDKLLNNGWKDGRPSDTSYPYCIEVDYNGKAGLFIYSNSKPRVSKVDIISDTHKQFNIYMVGMYGYVYNAINNCYINYDFTIKDGQKNFVQQYLFKYFSYELHCLDSDLNLTLFENYKGSDTDYKGTRVFFNWDITQDLKLSADDLQKLQDNCKEDIGAFTDSNGNKHGGDLNDYSDEDKNKFNESGSNSDSTTDNNFDFSFNGIMNYCDSFFSFIQSAFSVFPAPIWVLISLSIAMLVFLRVLGR